MSYDFDGKPNTPNFVQGICNKFLKTKIDRCQRRGLPEFNGRCKQHREPTLKDREDAKQARLHLAKKQEAEWQVKDLTRQTSEVEKQFIDHAVEHGAFDVGTAQWLAQVRSFRNIRDLAKSVYERDYP